MRCLFLKHLLSKMKASASANSIDPDESVHAELPHLHLDCLSSSSEISMSQTCRVSKIKDILHPLLSLSVFWCLKGYGLRPKMAKQAFQYIP